jgi:hypothetical protein
MPNVVKPFSFKKLAIALAEFLREAIASVAADITKG